MLSRDKYFGRALTLGATPGQLRIGQPRVLDISSVSGNVQLPARTGLNLGGPYYLLVNHSGATKTLKDENNTTLATLANNSVTAIHLLPSRWVAVTKLLGTKLVGTNGGSVRTVPVGYVSVGTTVTAPTSYDPIDCSGGYRRARICAIGTGDGGAMANIWMLDSEVSPHFVSSVATFFYQGVCYYFKESDPLLAGHGFTLSDGDVTWHADCVTCWTTSGGDPTGTGNCVSDSPDLPSAVMVRITYPTRPNDPENGDWEFTFIGGTSYVSPSLFRVNGCILDQATLSCAALADGGWQIAYAFSDFPCGGGGSVEYSGIWKSGVAQKLPPTGVYSNDPASNIFGAGDVADRPGMTFEVLGNA